MKSTKSHMPVAEILVRGLSRNVQEAHLQEIFGCYGNERRVTLPKEKYTEFHCGYAYIEYDFPALNSSDRGFISQNDSDSPSKKAIECMDGGQIDGLVIHVRHASTDYSSKNEPRIHQRRHSRSSSVSSCCSCTSSMSHASGSSSLSSLDSPIHKRSRDSHRRGRSTTPVPRQSAS